MHTLLESHSALQEAVRSLGYFILAKRLPEAAPSPHPPPPHKGRCISFQQDNYQDNFICNDACQSGALMKLEKFADKSGGWEGEVVPTDFTDCCKKGKNKKESKKKGFLLKSKQGNFFIWPSAKSGEKSVWSTSWALLVNDLIQKEANTATIKFHLITVLYFMIFIEEKIGLMYFEHLLLSCTRLFLLLFS